MGMVAEDVDARTLVRRRSSRQRSLKRLGSVALVFLLPVGAAIFWAYRTVPLRNNDDPQVDALLVLGSPTEIDGTLTAAQRWRMDEAIREYRAGRAPHIVISGGRTSRSYIEAQTMGDYAVRQGIPARAIVEEGSSTTTLQNIRNSQRILEARGWRRVEVISSPEHLPRAALMLRSTDLLWQMHAAPTPGRSRVEKMGAYTDEAVGTATFRLFGTHAEPVLHAIATAQHKIAFAVRWVYYRLEGSLRRL